MITVAENTIVKNNWKAQVKLDERASNHQGKKEILTLSADLSPDLWLS